jgi:hypothetical protein
MSEESRIKARLIKSLAKKRPTEIALAGARRLIEDLTTADIVVGVWPDGSESVLKRKDDLSNTGPSKILSIMKLQVPSSAFAELITASVRLVDDGMSAEDIETFARMLASVVDASGMLN